VCRYTRRIHSLGLKVLSVTFCQELEDAVSILKELSHEIVNMISALKTISELFKLFKCFKFIFRLDFLDLKGLCHHLRIN
jgi:hypothetical protein